MKLSDEAKNCQAEAFEDCSKKGFIKSVQEQCDCVPWGFSGALQQKVKPKNIYYLNFFSKVSDYCTPNDFSCYSKVAKITQDCRVSCTGLYADVWYEKPPVQIADDRARKMFEVLTKEGELDLQNMFL